MRKCGLLVCLAFGHCDFSYTQQHVLQIHGIWRFWQKGVCHSCRVPFGSTAAHSVQTPCPAGEHRSSARGCHREKPHSSRVYSVWHAPRPGTWPVGSIMSLGAPQGWGSHSPGAAWRTLHLQRHPPTHPPTPRAGASTAHIVFSSGCHHAVRVRNMKAESKPCGSGQEPVT